VIDADFRPTGQVVRLQEIVAIDPDRNAPRHD
jgi:hypothetical protein